MLSLPAGLMKQPEVQLLPSVPHPTICAQFRHTKRTRRIKAEKSLQIRNRLQPQPLFAKVVLVNMALKSVLLPTVPAQAVPALVTGPEQSSALPKVFSAVCVVIPGTMISVAGLTRKRATKVEHQTPVKPLQAQASLVQPRIPAVVVSDPLLVPPPRRPNSSVSSFLMVM